MNKRATKTLPLSLLVFFGLFTISLAWSFSQPLGAGPDEPAHIIKAAAVAHGELHGELTEIPGTEYVSVPAALGDAGKWNCFRGDQSITGSCQSGIESRPGDTDAKTSAALYNPAYYLAVGWPSLITDSPTLMVWAMRSLTALVSAAFCAGIFAVLCRLTSPFIALSSVGVFLTPMVIFLSSVVNPNAWEILGGLGFFAGLLWFGIAPNLHGKQSMFPATLLALGGAVSANTRGTSPFWLLLLGLLFLTVTPPDRIKTLLRCPPFLVSLGIAVVGAAASSAWTLANGTLGAMGEYPGQNETPFSAFVQMLVNAPSDPGFVGVLGWLDTPLPTFVYSIYGFGTIAVLVTAFSVTNTRWRIGLVLSIAMLYVAPAALQASTIQSSGWIWQARYALVLYVAVLLLGVVSTIDSAWSLPGRYEAFHRPAKRFLSLWLALVGLAQLWSFVISVQRYGVTTGGDVLTTFTSPDWEPAVFGNTGVLIVWLVGALLIGVSAKLAHSTFNRQFPGTERSIAL